MLWRIHFISTCSALCNCGQALCGPEFLTFNPQHQVCLCLYNGFKEADARGYGAPAIAGEHGAQLCIPIGLQLPH